MFHRWTNAAVSAAITAITIPAGDMIALKIPPILESPPFASTPIAFLIPPAAVTKFLAIVGKPIIAWAAVLIFSPALEKMPKKLETAPLTCPNVDINFVGKPVKICAADFTLFPALRSVPSKPETAPLACPSTGITFCAASTIGKSIAAACDPDMDPFPIPSKMLFMLLAIPFPAALISFPPASIS